MRFAYADPPYLGQGKRYAHLHPDALIWNDPAAHVALVDRLEAEYPDGWAVSLCPTPAALSVYAGLGRYLAVWVRPGMSAPPNGRVNLGVELVIYKTTVPNTREHGPVVSNYLIMGGPNQHQGKHTGTKPVEFCRWVLDLLGYDPDADELDDLFPGEGSMAHAAAEHRLILWDPNQAKRRRDSRGSRSRAMPSRTQDTLPL